MTTAKTYRKKPVEIQALQFDGEWAEDIINFGSEAHIHIDPGTGRLVIPTLEGDMTVSKGDYVIRGVQGEFYPCKEDIFLSTYEAVADSD